MRDRERNRQTHTHTHRHSDNQTGRQRKRERHGVLGPSGLQCFWVELPRPRCVYLTDRRRARLMP